MALIELALSPVAQIRETLGKAKAKLVVPEQSRLRAARKEVLTRREQEVEQQVQVAAQELVQVLATTSKVIVGQSKSMPKGMLF